jgi:DNA-binding transcriptional MerR regulator
MRVGEAAERVGTSARMLRYAEQLGLVAPARTAGGYRDYGERDLRAAAAALALQARYGVTPASLAFALRALEDPEVAGSLRRLARLIRRGPGNPATAQPGGGPVPRRPLGPGVPRWVGDPDGVAALDFETAKARRLLRLAS